jgi:chromosome segregation ATPase
MKRYEELNSQYDDFQKSSLEFEKELELQLEQSEVKIKELQNVNARYSVDNDTLKSKLNEINTNTHKQISQLQEELAKFKAVRDEMQKYIRELEQKNDNLEQTNRCAMFSLGEFESKLNEALERNSILEMELDDKDELAETVQRLRDEARDLYKI